MFEDIPVVALDTNRYYNPVWFYESSLPTKKKLLKSIGNTRFSYTADPNERKSFLPLPLITEVEFWINLPMVTDSSAFMINGVLSNATLWNISNNKRFFDSPANASVAIAEIAGNIEKLYDLSCEAHTKTSIDAVELFLDVVLDVYHIGFVVKDVLLFIVDDILLLKLLMFMVNVINVVLVVYKIKEKIGVNNFFFFFFSF